MIYGSLDPVEAGETVGFSVSTNFFDRDDIIYFAIRAYDNLNQTSEISKPFKLIRDVLPPWQITDLMATILDSNVEITFTATGDDWFQGTGKRPFC